MRRFVSLPSRGSRGQWLLLGLTLLFLLYAVAKLTAIPTDSTVLIHTATNGLTTSVLTITATFVPCRSHQTFTAYEDPKEVERYFNRSKPLTPGGYAVSSFLLQPRIIACNCWQSGNKSSQGDVGGTPTEDHAVDVDRASTSTVGAGDATGVEAANNGVALDLLVMVPSIPEAVQVRNAIRNSWGSVTTKTWPNSPRAWKVQLIFLLGKREGSSEASKTSPPREGELPGDREESRTEGQRSSTFNLTTLKEEWDVHGDLLVGDFVDSYRNLTLKMLTGLQWVSTHCASHNIRHVLKADQDTFVHVDLLLRELDHLYSRQPKEVMEGTLLGEVLCLEPVNRTPESKVRIYPSEYPFFSYPPYVRGGTYLIPGPLVTPIVRTSQLFPILPVEDAFLNGVVARALHVQHAHLKGVMPAMPCGLTPCSFVRNSVLTATNISPESMADMWRAVQAGPGYCQQHSSLWTRACEIFRDWF